MLRRWRKPSRTNAPKLAGTDAAGASCLLPTFLQRLADPSLRTIMLCGCGGGFDFVHSLVLYPELRRLGKQVVLGSYSFGDPRRIAGATPVFNDGQALAVRASAANVPDAHYGPEVHVCSFLDRRYPDAAPHYVYAYYARAFCVPQLTRLYRQLRDAHDVDAIVLVDGGSDSLMAGDEEGLGDPIEDAVSVTTVADLTGLKAKLLVTIGLGTDRYNHVSDAATLRAIAELTQAGGFLGAASVERSSPGAHFYRACLRHIHRRQQFRSVLAGTIDAAIQGWFGSARVPPGLERRVRPGQLYLWPLMAMAWGFDVEKVAERSLLSRWIRRCQSVEACHARLREGRAALHAIRAVENLPRHEEFRGKFD
jgi:hypothetical protein